MMEAGTNWAGHMAYKAYALGHVSEIVDTAGRPGHVHLISISRYGARLRRFGESLSLPLGDGDALRLNVCLERYGVETGNIPCYVEWVDGDEIYVTFHDDLSLGATELQALLTV